MFIVLSERITSEFQIQSIVTDDPLSTVSILDPYRHFSRPTAIEDQKIGFSVGQGKGGFFASNGFRVPYN